MGFYVHLSVVMAADDNEPIAKMAQEFLDTNPELSREADWYLKDLKTRIGTNNGPKGGLSLWGIVGNYKRPEDFVNCLKPFWETILRSEGTPYDFERIIVFYEREASEHASCYQIGLENDVLEIKHFPDLPFAWMQF